MTDPLVELEELIEARVAERTRDLQAELEEVRALNAAFETVANGIDVMIWSTAPDLSKWHYINTASERVFGFTLDQIAADPTVVYDRFHPDDLAVIAEAVNRGAEGEVVHTEYRMRVATGDYRWFLTTAYPVFDEQGGVERFLGAGVDITERKELESALGGALAEASESTRRFEMIANTVDTNFWITAPDLSAWHYLNPPIAEMIGHTAEEIYADPGLLLAAYHPDDIDPVLEALSRVALGEPTEVEHRLRRPDGSYVWLWSKGFPDFDDNGNVVRVVGTSADITDRKQLEAELEAAMAQVSKSNKRFEMIAGTIDTHFWITAPDLSSWIYLNPAIAKSLGHTVEEMYADPQLIPSLFHPADTATISAALADIASGQQVEFEFRCKVADGSYHWFWSKGYPEWDEHGSVARIIGSSTDINEHKRLTAELQVRSEEALAASKAKSAFLATMTHELRTPVIGVTGMLEVLAHTDLDPVQRHSLSVVRQSADSLLQILGDVLDVSKIEAGRLELAPTVTSVPHIVERVAHDFIHAASSKGLLLTVEVDDRISPAHLADGLRIRQILTNFTSNALKFTSQGTIHVAARLVAESEGNQQLELSVADTGIGISPENQADLFEAFTQAESSTTRRYGGTGLGLNICRLLADMMDADVVLESQLGVGTTLTFRASLPLADPALLPPEEPDDHALAIGRPPRAREQALAEGSLLLLVEDHRINRLVLTQQLELAGFAVDVAADGAEALRAWRDTPYALVFTDLHMPEMDGRDLVRAIRADEQARGLERTPVLGLTAAALRDELESCVAAGMDDVMLKPTSIPALLGALRRWLPGLEWETPVAVAPASAPADDSPGLRGLIADLAGGDQELFDELHSSFLTTTREDVERLAGAVAERDQEEVRRRAHRILGSSRTVGAEGLAALAASLEDASASADWTVIGGHADALASAAERLLAH